MINIKMINNFNVIVLFIVLDKKIYIKNYLDLIIYI